MTASQTDFNIFYSWQSDLPDETNRGAIRTALRSASSNVEADYPSHRILIDEATRGESGSPNIPHTILEKIKTCDAFVCDITTINAGSESRRTPNPNVLFELGYAVAHIGWSRVVMLFNEKLGNFPIDAPFDIDRHRVSTYTLSAQDAKSRSGRAALEKLATAAIKKIILKQPSKPFSLRLQTPEEIKRQRDIVSIKWAMSAIHIPTLDDMIYRLPRYLDLKALHFWESFNGIITNSLFHVYDKQANTALRSVHKAWKECVSHGGQYHVTSNLNLYCFANPGDGVLNEKQEQEWRKIESACDNLRESFARLLGLIRQRYLEIDLDETNRIAGQDYIDSEKELDKQFEH